MLKVRIIPTLLEQVGLVKGTQFDPWRVGPVVPAIEVYTGMHSMNSRVILDIDQSRAKRPSQTYLPLRTLSGHVTAHIRRRGDRSRRYSRRRRNPGRRRQNTD